MRLGDMVAVASNGMRFHATLLRMIPGRPTRARVTWRNAKGQKRFATVNTKRIGVGP